MSGVTREGPDVYRRRRLSALGVVAGVALLAGAAAGAGDGEGDDGGRNAAARSAAQAPPPPVLPGGGRSIFPEHRVVAFYGAPQDDELGELGIGTPDSAGRRLRKQAAPYARK